MAYVKCHGCTTIVHFTPIDVDEFHKRYVEGNEPIYCYNCWKKKDDSK